MVAQDSELTGGQPQPLLEIMMACSLPVVCRPKMWLRPSILCVLGVWM